MLYSDCPDTVSILYIAGGMKKNIEDMNFAEGEMLLIDKPYGWSSFGIVAQFKKWTKAKIGHAGTLDPLADGLMICCTGKWTKKLTGLIGLDKEYTGIIRIGEQTATYDLESIPEQKVSVDHITEPMIKDCILAFTGSITQYPPIHSAIKQGGKPVYELARQGKEVTIQPRQVFIHAFEITQVSLPDIHFRIHCSSGTYIRSIANDVGQALHVGGYLRKLTRTKIGEYSLTDALNMHELAQHFGSAMKVRMIEPKG